MSATASGLHPLQTALPEGELQLVLRHAAHANEEVVVECDYQAYRERDVRKDRTLHLLDLSPWRIGRDKTSVQREEGRRVTQTVRAVDGTVTLTVPRHDPDPEYRAYQLARVRVGDVRLECWFPAAPSLDPGFGLVCSAEELHGTVRPGGITAAPLHGTLPLWPELRQVTITIAPVIAPVVRLWDPRSRHDWDGWRQSIPASWPGGETIVARHVDGPTAWRSHEYYAVQPDGAPAVTHPAPPRDVLPGVALEVYWPQGDAIQLPDLSFDRPADVIPIRVARLTSRARELLARSVESRPGVELHSLTADEWNEFAPLIDAAVNAPVEFALRKMDDAREVMTIQRLELHEPWLYLFGVEYDAGRRFGIKVLFLTPAPWGGALPE